MGDLELHPAVPVVESPENRIAGVEKFGEVGNADLGRILLFHKKIAVNRHFLPCPHLFCRTGKGDFPFDDIAEFHLSSAVFFTGQDVALHLPGPCAFIARRHLERGDDHLALSGRGEHKHPGVGDFAVDTLHTA